VDLQHRAVRKEKGGREEEGGGGGGLKIRALSLAFWLLATLSILQ
jgi:hypothetical protein